MVAQSGGPTAVINSSIAGVISEAGRHECIEEIYGGMNGVYGILQESLIDIGFDPTRVARVTGHADQEHAVRNPMAARNNRLEVIFLRQ